MFFDFFKKKMDNKKITGLAKKVGETSFPGGKLEVIKLRMPEIGNETDDKYVNDICLSFIGILKSMLKSTHDEESTLYNDAPPEMVEYLKRTHAERTHAEFMLFAENTVEYLSNHADTGTSPKTTFLMELLLVIHSYITGNGAFFREVFEDVAGIVIQDIEVEKFSSMLQQKGVMPSSTIKRKEVSCAE